MKRAAKITLIVSTLLLVLMFFMAVSVFLQAGANNGPVTIDIPKGASANQAAALLRQEGIIKRTIDFKFASRILFLTDKIKAGRYRFPAHPSLFSVLLDLKNARTIVEEPLKVTFPEGTSIYRMGLILEKAGAVCSEEIRSLVDSSFVEKLKGEFHFLDGVKSRSLEGYLFPDTYMFDRNISAEALARLMLRRFSDVVLPYWNDNKYAARYDLHQIVTLASIIEKEARRPEERPVISSVFYNRLEIQMPLAADPTVKYALERPSKTVFFDQLKVNSPYNTYKNRGLPPGPISNPGLDSIKAAIYPAKTDYLFFVAQTDGSHIFSATMAQHENARVRAKRSKKTSR